MMDYGIDNKPEILPLKANKFEVPGVGRFEVDIDNHHVKFFRKQETSIEKMIEALSKPDLLGIEKALSDAKGSFLISKRFADMAELHANIPELANLSKGIESMGKGKARFVLEFGEKNHKGAKIAINEVKAAFRDSGVDAHVFSSKK